MPPFHEAAARPETIPGLGSRAAEVIVAEIGADMMVFPTAGHLASWAGLCPGNNESAGRRRTGRTTKGSQWLRTTLVQVAWSASHTKETILSATYRRWAKRMGKKKALVVTTRAQDPDDRVQTPEGQERIRGALDGPRSSMRTDRHPEGIFRRTQSPRRANPGVRPRSPRSVSERHGAGMPGTGPRATGLSRSIP